MFEWLKWKLHKHDFRFYGQRRVEMGLWSKDPNPKTFWIAIYLCSNNECSEVKALASDMEPYLKMKSYHMGAR